MYLISNNLPDDGAPPKTLPPPPATDPNVLPGLALVLDPKTGPLPEDPITALPPKAGELPNAGVPPKEGAEPKSELELVLLTIPNAGADLKPAERNMLIISACARLLLDHCFVVCTQRVRHFRR